MTPPEGRAESIRHRLRNRLRERGENLASGLERYAAERFLYRLGQSRLREQFILKGGMLMALRGTLYRPTRDLDFTGYGNAAPDELVAALREICGVPDPVAELVFETDTIACEPIRDDSEYHGYRVIFWANLGASRIRLQVDVGFGNDIVPGPEELECRTLLDDPAPRVLAYPHESVIAEKLHALVLLGERNSRYKDFYDLHAMAGAFPFNRDTLVRAMRATFERRATPLTADVPVALTDSFYAGAARAGQWQAYASRNDLIGVSSSFPLVGERIILFLLPVWEDLVLNRPVSGIWTPDGPWRQS